MDPSPPDPSPSSPSSPDPSPSTVTESVRKRWAEVSLEPVAAKQEEEQRVVAARKQVQRVVTWELNDDKHRKLPDILDTVKYLIKIMNNVLESPDDPKFRRIRIANKTFGQHVRDAPGGETFMIAAGWRAEVRDLQRCFVFEQGPGSVEWAVFGEAAKELGKLEALLEGKLARGAADRKAEEALRREQARLAIEEDRQDRHAKFTYKE